MRRTAWGGATTCLLLALFAAPARAGDLADVKARGALVWGADQEGGGPYVYPREDDPDRVTGFEVDIADRLARYLGVTARFSQGPWDKLLDLLHARKVDVVLNGYEWNEVRAERYEATIPYFVYGLQLLARKDDATIASLEDLGRPAPDGHRRKIGVLTGSAAEDYVREKYADALDVVSYDGNTDSMREVETGKLDATFQDTPIARFYGPSFPKLHEVGAPVAKGYYVLYARRGADDLVRALNESIILLVRSGELQRICERYGIWDDNQAELLAIAKGGRFFGYQRSVAADTGAGDLPTEAEVRSITVGVHGWTVVQRYLVPLLESAGMTVFLSVLSFPIAILIGLLVAVGRRYGPGWVARPLALYVEILRGTPLMLQLYFVFFLLPEVGVNLPALATAIVGLAVNYSAYEAEIYRAGLQAVPHGQMEAALALGMSRAQAVRRVIVPQAVRVVIPPVVNDFISLFKDTSVCSVVTVVELTKRFSVLAMSTQAIVEMMAMTCVLYLAMSYPMAVLSRRLERRLGFAGALA